VFKRDRNNTASAEDLPLQHTVVGICKLPRKGKKIIREILLQIEE
jgi:hypothetical protein